MRLLRSERLPIHLDFNDLKAGGELSFVATQDLPDFHPSTVLWEWENGEAFHLADALTGVFGATGSGKTSGPAKHLAYGYLANNFGGLVLCAKKEERIQWERWAAECGRGQDLVIADSTGKFRFNFLEREVIRPELIVICHCIPHCILQGQNGAKTGQPQLKAK